MIQQGSTDIALEITGLEPMFANPFHANSKTFVIQAVSPKNQCFFNHIIKVSQRIALYSGKFGDSWGSAQQIYNLAGQLLVDRADDLNFLPVLLKMDGRIDVQ